MNNQILKLNLNNNKRIYRIQSRNPKNKNRNISISQKSV